MSRANQYYRWGLFCLLFLLPLVYFPKSYNVYEQPKFWLLVGGSWLLAVVKALGILGERNKDKQYFPIFDRLTVLVFLYILITFVSDLLGLDIRTSILGSYWRHQGWITWASGALLFLILRLFSWVNTGSSTYFDTGSHTYLRSGQKGTKQAWLLQNMLLASVFLVSVFACWQGIWLYIVNDIAVPNYHGRIVGTLGNPNFLGGWLAISLPLVLGTGSLAKSKTLNKSLKATLSLMVLLAIFFSGSRGAWLAVGVVGTVWLLAKRKWKILTIVIVSFLLASTLLFLHPEVVRRVGGLTPWVNRYSVWENRLLIWQEGVKAVAKRPVLGYGQENFALVFPPERHFPVDNSHNLFLEILIASGAVGLACYLLILIEAFKKAPLVIRLSLLAFVVRAQFNPLSIPEIALFWYLLAFA